MLTLRERVALAVPPLILRILLGVTFIWAGAGKLFSYIEVQGEKAAILANLKVIAPPAPPAAPPAPTPAPPEQVPKPAGPESTTPPSAPLPEPAPPAMGGGFEASSRSVGLVAAALVTAAPKPRSLAETEPGKAPPATPPAPDAPSAPLPDAKAPATPPGKHPATAGQFTAQDFPSPVRARRWADLTIALHGATSPTDGGSARMPKEWGRGKWPVRLALFVSWTEFVGGVLVLIGFVTRLAALLLAGVKATAIWVAAIGPILLGPPGVPSFWGFLPPLNGFEPSAWAGWLWQFALVMSALALALSKPGLLSLDGLLFTREEKPDSLTA